MSSKRGEGKREFILLNIPIDATKTNHYTPRKTLSKTSIHAESHQMNQSAQSQTFRDQNSIAFTGTPQLLWECGRLSS